MKNHSFIKAIPRREIKWLSRQWRDICRCLLIKGERLEAVVEFERQFAQYIGCRHAIAVSSGRVAFRLILQALKLEQCSEIIIPAYTEEAVPYTVQSVGHVPIFIDIRRDTHTLDECLIAPRITDRTRAILATHLFGYPCHLEALHSLCKRYGIILVEDCAHTVGQKYRGRMLGTFGRASFFSFAGTKPFQTFGGGMVCTDDGCIAERIRDEVRMFPCRDNLSVLKTVVVNYGLHILCTQPNFGITIYPVLRMLDVFGKDIVKTYRMLAGASRQRQIKMYRLHPLQACVGISMLKHNDSENRLRRHNARRLRDFLDPCARVMCLRDHPDHGYYFFVLQSEYATQISRNLLRAGVDTGKGIMRVCPHVLGFDGKYPCAEYAFLNSLQCPIHTSLSEDDIFHIAQSLNEAVRRLSP